MNCPKCGKPLIPMQNKNFAYCSKRDLVVKFGDPYNRRYNIVKDESTGCGTVFILPVSELDWLAEIERRYRPRVTNIGRDAAVGSLASSTK